MVIVPELFLWDDPTIFYSISAKDIFMPLAKGKSAKTFKKNVKTEVKAIEAKGKSPKKAAKQAVAIAYSVKLGKKKK
jgi:hypothetical protein